MAIEIERKFKVASEDWRAGVVRSQRMCQGYLGGDACSVRVRIAGDAAWLNIKSKVPGRVRDEFEYAIPLAEGVALLALCVGPCIVKTRHWLHHAGREWEIDEFEGDNAGLVVAEIELDAVEAVFERPAWLGIEVTDDVRYYNAQLVREPYSLWRET